MCYKNHLLIPWMKKKIIIEWFKTLALNYRSCSRNQLITKIWQYLIPKLDKDHILIGCRISNDLDAFNKLSGKKEKKSSENLLCNMLLFLLERKSLLFTAIIITLTISSRDPRKKFVATTYCFPKETFCLVSFDRNVILVILWFWRLISLNKPWIRTK